MIYVKDLLNEIHNVVIGEYTDLDYYNGKPDPAWEYIDKIIERLPNVYEDDVSTADIATNGVEILFRMESDCEKFADALDDYIFGSRKCITGSYDREEDERDDCVDANSGWYYITWV